MNGIYPTYPKDSFVYLKKKKWVEVTQNILKEEGIKGISVYAEPGEWYRWKLRPFSIWDDFTDKIEELYLYYIKGKYPPVVLGSHVIITERKDGVKTEYRSIHFSTIRPGHEVMDTIIHEIAHEMSPDPGHGESWKKEYRRLRAKYIKNPRCTSDNDKGMFEKL